MSNRSPGSQVYWDILIEFPVRFLGAGAWQIALPVLRYTGGTVQL
jgi:hypothetical protein